MNVSIVNQQFRTLASNQLKTQSLIAQESPTNEPKEQYIPSEKSLIEIAGEHDLVVGASLGAAIFGITAAFPCIALAGAAAAATYMYTTWPGSHNQ